MNIQHNVDTLWMSHALQEAHKAQRYGEVPVGAIVIKQGRIIGRGYNTPITQHDPSGHAEINALRDAAAYTGNYRLVGAELFVTIEPCMMCLGAAIHARIERLVYGATEPKAGVICSAENLYQKSWLNHRINVTGGILDSECSETISRFFAARRKAKRKK